MSKQYVFGYGSLVSARDVARTLGRRPSMIHPVRLNGWIRDWSVVIDNTTAEHRCVKLEDGTAAPVRIVVLNVRAPGRDEAPTNPNGVLFEVTEEELSKMDERETHYHRLDVTKDVVNAPTGTVYVYTGKDEFLLGDKLESGLVIPGAYSALVGKAFQSLTPSMHDEYLKSTRPSDLPIRH